MSGSPEPRPGSVGWNEELLAVSSAAACWVGADLAPSPCRSALVGGLGALLVLLGLGIRAGSGHRQRGRTRHSWPTRPSRLAAIGALVGILLVGGHRGAAADAAYRPLPAGPLSDRAVVVGDPEPAGAAGWIVELRLTSGARIEATAYGQTGAALSRATVGATLEVTGRLRTVGDRSWLRTRHIVALASIDEAELVAGPGLPRRVAEVVRERIGAGGAGFDDRNRALYEGLVLGDDRFQPAGQVLRFRLAGLSHLLAVSGQNVAFVLAAAGPLLHRLGGRRRLLAATTVLVLFAVITRLEPSVLRAVSTAGISTWAATTGRSRSGLGVLAAATVVLVLVDPFLVDSIGFQLSVAASLGILALGPALDRRLPGPRWLVLPLTTSLAAQAGVAPVLQHHFGPVSLVAIPANLLAGWAAGFIMTWGMTVGPVAGLLPRSAASVVQWPAGRALWWLETVAAAGARLPDPRPSLTVLVGLLVVTLLARASGRRPVQLLALAASVAAIVVSVPRAPDRPGPCGSGIAWLPAGSDGPSVLVVGERAGITAVEDCRARGIRSVDVLVVRSGDRSSATTVAALREVVAIETSLAPPRHAVVGARRLLVPTEIEVAAGRLDLRPDPSGRRIDAHLGP